MGAAELYNLLQGGYFYLGSSLLSVAYTLVQVG